MARRRKRGAAYRARREALQNPMVDYQLMADAARLPVDVLFPQELSTPDEVAAFFADNVTRNVKL
jgi:hypothetical protein